VFKHLFEHAIREDLSENKKDLVRDYLKPAGCSSYDADKLEGKDFFRRPTHDRDPGYPGTPLYLFIV
jgi:hypothetical protein